MNDLTEDDEEWECLIKSDSPFLALWEILVSIMLLFNLYVLPLNIGTNDVLLYAYYMMYGRIFFMIISLILLLDIIINFVSEQNLSEVKKTVFIKQSAKIYLKRYFLVDCLTAIFCTIIAFADRIYIG
mmetsp:Transcript_40759/g.62206  ORF Transcript_40759/g.62206 Transcript_40759/m.62206 type:complete len:128 (-) Transcript_40759:608-991(-)